MVNLSINQELVSKLSVQEKIYLIFLSLNNLFLEKKIENFPKFLLLNINYLLLLLFIYALFELKFRNAQNLIKKNSINHPLIYFRVLYPNEQYFIHALVTIRWKFILKFLR